MTASLAQVLSAISACSEGLRGGDLASASGEDPTQNYILERMARQLRRADCVTLVAGRPLSMEIWRATEVGLLCVDNGVDLGSLPTFGHDGRAHWPGIEVWVWLNDADEPVVSLDEVNDVEPTRLELPSDPRDLHYLWRLCQVAENPANRRISIWTARDQDSGEQWVTFDRPLDLPSRRLSIFAPVAQWTRAQLRDSLIQSVRVQTNDENPGAAFQLLSCSLSPKTTSGKNRPGKRGEEDKTKHSVHASDRATKEMEDVINARRRAIRAEIEAQPKRRKAQRKGIPSRSTEILQITAVFHGGLPGSRR